MPDRLSMGGIYPMRMTLGQLRRLLVEQNRPSTEGVQLEGVGQSLLKYVNVGYMTFSNINKLGINPRTHFKTPVGIYTYPITHELVAEFVNSIKRHPRSTKPQPTSDGLPFGQDRPFIHVMVPRNPEKIIDIAGITIEEALELAHRVDKVRGVAPVDLKQFKKATKKSFVKTPGGRLWYYTIDPADIGDVDFYGTVEVKNPMAWRKLWMSIGVDGVVDHGTGVIHKNEPTQAVFFSLGILQQVATLSNPAGRREKTKRARRQDDDELYQTISGFRKLYQFFIDTRDNGYSNPKDYEELALAQGIPSPYPERKGSGAINHIMKNVIEWGWMRRWLVSFNKTNNFKSFLKDAAPGLAFSANLA